MSRDDGFPVADIDSSYLDDAKMRVLWQRLQDTSLMTHAVLLHQATFLASWRHGERVTVAEAAPTWLPVDGGLVAHLRAVKLLDRSGRVPCETWDRWFGPALARREARRKAGRTGGQASGRARSTDAEANVQQTSTDAEPVRPSVQAVQAGPSVPSGDAPADASEDREPDPADAYWTLTGKYPTDKPLGWIDDLTRTYGAMAVIRAVGEAHRADPATASLLGRAQDRLRRDARTLDLKAQAAAQTAIVARRSTPRPVTDEAERQRVIRELMGAPA